MKRVSSFSTTALSKHPLFSQFSQLSQSQFAEDEKKPFIYFVVPPGKTVEECRKLNLGEMFSAAEAHSLNVSWIKDEECDDQELHEDGSIFVFDPFGSPGFECIKHKISRSPHVEILSPTVLIEVFNDPQQSQFETKGSPVYTLAMKDMVISLSGFKDKTKKDDVERLVRWMNGTLAPSLTKAVTHVIAATTITPKSIEANKQKIPVMTEEWVEQVWKDNHAAPAKASHNRYVKYVCPIFYNVNICMSQITAVKKTALKSGIESQGGKCAQELIKKVTDVLVVPSPSGDKYKFALKWNVKCVIPQWVENSIEKGRILPLDDYLVSDCSESNVPRNYDVGPITSTPAHSVMPEWNMTRCSVIVDDDRAVVEASKTNFTKTCTEIHEETMSKLRAVPEKKAYLDGCKIYLVEYPKCDELKREINKSGAVRLNQLCEGVTHVIVSGQKLPKTIQDKIMELESTPYVVTIGWVLQSAKDGNPADEEIFKYEPNTIVQETFTEPPNLNLSSRVCRVSASATNLGNPQAELSPMVPSAQSTSTSTNAKHSASSSNNKTNGTVIGYARPSSKLNSRPKETLRSNSPTVNPTNSSKSSSGLSSNDTSKESKSSSEGTTDNEDPDMTQEENTTEVGNADEPSSPGLLVGITFKIVIDDSEERKYLEETVVESGGKLVKQNADVAILSPVCCPIEKNRADKSCTKYWLFECLECNSLDIQNSFYHIPMPSFDGMEDVFRGVVIAISQYQGAEREYISMLVSSLGGIYQDVFARKDSADRKNVRSTHLICKNMETDKAKAAKKWNVPAVVAEWVIDSFLEGKRLEESRYDPSQVNTTDERTVFMATPQRRRSMNANNGNNNLSVRSVYPPSTQKGGPETMFKKNKDTRSDKEKEKSLEPPPALPSTSVKSANPGTSSGGFKAPSTPPKKAVSGFPQPSTSSKVVSINGEEDKSLTPETPEYQKHPDFIEYTKKMAELKSTFPYTDESFEQGLEDLKARGIDLDQVSPFTSFEEQRLCNPDPDSPLLLGLPRHESRALKEQFEIALNRSPNIPKIKVKTPVNTPLREIVRRFNAISSKDVPVTPPAPSTPREDLRRRATLNRLSQGNLNISFNADDEPTGLEGIRKLVIKRPSDGSPEEEEHKSSKRARKSSEEDNSDEDLTSKKTTSPNENNVPNRVLVQENDGEKPSSSKKPDRMRHLTNLIAESQSNSNDDARAMSPIKRRSGDKNMLIPDDEIHEEIERPHLSWVETEEEQNQKSSTVKKVAPKTRIVPEPEPTVEQNPVPETEGRKRSSRLRRTPSVVAVEETGGRVTRQTRNRSNSKSRKEDDAPLGHQPFKVAEGKKSKKKKKVAEFPIELPDNPVFGLSSLDQREKLEATKIIMRLGGSVSKAANFDIDCNAVITTRLLRSEKILGCIASGKYLLKPEYLNKSDEEGYFVPIDETFLWHESNINEEKERELARASYGWLKLQMANDGKRPMTGMKFFILDQPADKVKAFERLIEAGGGVVVTDIEAATIVIKDDKSTTSVPEGKSIANPLHLNVLILRVPEST